MDINILQIMHLRAVYDPKYLFGQKLTFFCSAVPPQQCEKSNYINFDTYDTIKFLIAMQTQYYDLYIFICTCIAPIPKGGIHYKSLG